MSGKWKGSTRRDTLPKNWARIREVVLRNAGYRCEEETPSGRCVAVANQVDHVGDREDHRPENLRALCQPHHDLKSSRQGVEARAARRAARLRPPLGDPSRLR